MKRIVDYYILTNDCPDELSEYVKENIAIGWQPLGGHRVVAFPDKDGGYWVEYQQTVVRYADNELQESRKRINRKSLDQSLLLLLKNRNWENSQTFTVSQIFEEWHQLYPDTPIGRTTVREILDRLVKQEENIVILKNGSVGRSNPRTYKW